MQTCADVSPSSELESPLEFNSRPFVLRRPNTIARWTPRSAPSHGTSGSRKRGRRSPRRRLVCICSAWRRRASSRWSCGCGRPSHARMARLSAASLASARGSRSMTTRGTVAAGRSSRRPCWARARLSGTSSRSAPCRCSRRCWAGSPRASSPTARPARARRFPCSAPRAAATRPSSTASCRSCVPSSSAASPLRRDRASASTRSTRRTSRSSRTACTTCSRPTRCPRRGAPRAVLGAAALLAACSSGPSSRCARRATATSWWWAPRPNGSTRAPG